MSLNNNLSLQVLLKQSCFVVSQFIGINFNVAVRFIGPILLFFSFFFISDGISYEKKDEQEPYRIKKIEPKKIKDHERLFAGGQVELVVIVLNYKEKPLPNQEVIFRIETIGGNRDSYLSATTVFTRIDGSVTTTLTTDTDYRVINKVSATVPAIVGRHNTVLFRIHTWPDPLTRIYENYNVVDDIEAIKIDKGKSGDQPIPETKVKYLFKKPDKSKTILLSDSQAYAIFNNGTIYSVVAGETPVKIQSSEVSDINFNQINYRYNPILFKQKHNIKIDRIKKRHCREVYKIEATPITSNISYNKLVVYVDYKRGLDFETEHIGTNNNIISKTEIKKAKLRIVKEGKWHHKDYNYDEEDEDEFGDNDDGKIDIDEDDCKIKFIWLPVKTEQRTFISGNSQDISNTVTVESELKDISINVGIPDSEFVIP